MIPERLQITADLRASTDLLRLRQRYAEQGGLCAAIRSRGGAFDGLNI